MKNFICKYKTPEEFDDLVMCGVGELLERGVGGVHGGLGEGG